jgi:hypothetical protein
MSVPATWPQVLNFFSNRLIIAPSPGQFSSDAGLLPIRQFDQRVRLTRAFAACARSGRLESGDVPEASSLAWRFVRLRLIHLCHSSFAGTNSDGPKQDALAALIARAAHFKAHPAERDLGGEPTVIIATGA